MAAVKAYLCACAIYRDEAPYIREWVEFHRLVGVERFFLYDNGSVDHHREELAPYLEENSVLIHDWPLVPGQGPAYDDCLKRHRSDARWIAFLDLDEFLFSPTRRPLSEVLVDYEEWPGVCVNRATFGTSGHRDKPPGLVIENYVRRLDPPKPSVKSIVDPTRAIRCRNPHSFVYDVSLPVDENKHPIEGWVTSPFSLSRLRINHYYTKSEAEFRGKLGKGRADTGLFRSLPNLGEISISGEFEDHTIMMCVPDLRKALARYRSTNSQTHGHRPC